MKALKNNLDEMQEQKLLKIEHNGCWLAFWGLLAAMLAQSFIYAEDASRYMAGEWAVFMLLSVYMLADCLRAGVWDRHLKASPKANLLYSGVAAVVMGVAYFFIALKNYGDMRTAILTGVMMLASVFVACFLALLFCAAIYKKRLKKLESQGEDKTEEKGEI